MRFNINELERVGWYGDKLVQLVIVQSNALEKQDFKKVDEINRQFKETAIIHALLSGCSVKLEDDHIIIGGPGNV